MKLSNETTALLILQTRNVTVSSNLNDGSWHHMCTSWRKKDGMYAIYVDQHKVGEGSGYKTDQVIKGGGTFAIGQRYLGKSDTLSIWLIALEYNK